MQTDSGERRWKGLVEKMDGERNDGEGWLREMMVRGMVRWKMAREGDGEG